MKRKLLSGLAVLVVLAGAVISTQDKAQAHPVDERWTWGNCENKIYNTSLAYYYQGQGIYATGWEAYSDHFDNQSLCEDINVGSGSSGSMTVRAVYCQHNGVCTTPGWGTLIVCGTCANIGAVMHNYQIPTVVYNDTVFRYESLGVSENFEGAW